MTPFTALYCQAAGGFAAHFSLPKLACCGPTGVLFVYPDWREYIAEGDCSFPSHWLPKEELWAFIGTLQFSVSAVLITQGLLKWAMLIHGGQLLLLVYMCMLLNCSATSWWLGQISQAWYNLAWLDESFLFLFLYTKFSLLKKIFFPDICSSCFHTSLIRQCHLLVRVLTTNGISPLVRWNIRIKSASYRS